MISDLEMESRVFVKTASRGGKVIYFVMSDGDVIFETPSRQVAFLKQREAREKLSIEEALYDAELRVRPEELRKKQADARRMVCIQDPDICRDFPIAWRVFYGPVLIGSYRSRWEAEQYRDRVILNGGY